MYGVLPAMIAMPWATPAIDAKFTTLTDEVDRENSIGRLFARLAGNERVYWAKAHTDCRWPGTWLARR